MPRAADLPLPSDVLERYAQVLLSELDRRSSWVERHWKQIGRDALDNAPSSVWLKIINGKFDPSKGNLPGWLNPVLKRSLVDQGRLVVRRKRHEALASPVANGHSTPLTRAATRDDVELAARENEMRRFPSIPFSADDLRSVQSWSLYDRVLLLCLAGLWRKVPATLWGAWVAESALRHGWPSSVVLSFLSAAETRESRTAILANELSLSRNNLNQQWCRKKHLVRNLRCIRELNG